MKKILIVRKMSALEYYDYGSHGDQSLHESKQEQDGNLNTIEKILKKENIEYDFFTRRELHKNAVKNYDFVISAGGDGTAIAAAAYNESTPQLNLRTDIKSDGKLCQHDIEQALKLFLDGNYDIERWTRQDVFLDGKFIGRALNETGVGESNAGEKGLDFTKMPEYQIMFKNEEGYFRDKHENSGLFIVTGTGSTGWSGIFEPYSRASKIFKFSTLAPTKNPDVNKINTGEGTLFRIKYQKHEGKVKLDTIAYPFPRNSVVDIILSLKPLPVVIPKKKEEK